MICRLAGRFGVEFGESENFYSDMQSVNPYLLMVIINTLLKQSLMIGDCTIREY